MKKIFYITTMALMLLTTSSVVAQETKINDTWLGIYTNYYNNYGQSRQAEYDSLAAWGYTITDSNSIDMGMAIRLAMKTANAPKEYQEVAKEVDMYLRIYTAQKTIGTTRIYLTTSYLNNRLCSAAVRIEDTNTILQTLNVKQAIEMTSYLAQQQKSHFDGASIKGTVKGKYTTYTTFTTAFGDLAATDIKELALDYGKKNREETAYSLFYKNDRYSKKKAKDGDMAAFTISYNRVNDIIDEIIK